jgi:cell division ATPase FtsA
MQYLLNGRRIKNLVGQRGECIALEILATFLPREVVDSLFAVLDRTGLEMTSLTLEPIAASEVVIPESMRQLSLALVDVGAGTSDIALCAEGTMIAFAMVPEAGMR